LGHRRQDKEKPEPHPACSGFRSGEGAWFADISALEALSSVSNRGTPRIDRVALDRHDLIKISKNRRVLVLLFLRHCTAPLL